MENFIKEEKVKISFRNSNKMYYLNNESDFDETFYLTKKELQIFEFRKGKMKSDLYKTISHLNKNLHMPNVVNEININKINTELLVQNISYKNAETLKIYFCDTVNGGWNKFYYEEMSSFKSRRYFVLLLLYYQISYSFDGSNFFKIEEKDKNKFIQMISDLYFYEFVLKKFNKEYIENEKLNN